MDKSTIFSQERRHYEVGAGGEVYLIGSACRHCGSRFFPVVVMCPTCFRDDGVEETRLNRYGRVAGSTVARVGPAGFESMAPYAVAWVDLEDGPRLFAQIEDLDPHLPVGARVEVVEGVIRRDQDQRETLGYKFRRVRA